MFIIVLDGLALGSFHDLLDWESLACEFGRAFLTVEHDFIIDDDLELSRFVLMVPTSGGSDTAQSALIDLRPPLLDVLRVSLCVGLGD